MYNGDALGRRRQSSRRRKKDRAAVFTAPAMPRPGEGRKIARFGAAMIVIATLGASIPEAYSGLQGSDLFKLQEIRVVGSDLMSPEEVVATSGLSPGTNLFEANLQTATDSIVSHPLVRSALLLRRPPDSLVISVEERVPIALVSTNEGLLGFDKDATSFELPNVPFDLPIVTGLNAVLSDSTLSEFAMRHTVARFLQEAQLEQPEFWSCVSEVCILTDKEGDLILASGMTLKIRYEQIASQIENYRVFVASGDIRPENFAYIDLRYVNQVVAGRLDPASVPRGPGSIEIPD